MVRGTFGTCNIYCKIFKECLTILGSYALRDLKYWKITYEDVH